MRLPAGTFASENRADHGGCGGPYDANFNAIPEAGVVGKKATHGVHRAIGVSAEGISVSSAIRTSVCEDFIPANTIDFATGDAKAITELSTLGIRASQVCSHVRRCRAEAKGFHVVMKD